QLIRHLALFFSDILNLYPIAKFSVLGRTILRRLSENDFSLFIEATEIKDITPVFDDISIIYNTATADKIPKPFVPLVFTNKVFFAFLHLNLLNSAKLKLHPTHENNHAILDINQFEDYLRYK